jgi:hypothetical protein
MVQKGLEFDFGVAQDVGVGGAPSLVFAQKLRKNTVFVIGRKIDVLDLDAQYICNSCCIDEVDIRRAVLAVIVVFPILHEDANDVMALLLEQMGSDSRIDAAGQADDHTVKLGHVAIIPRPPDLPDKVENL